MKRPEGRAPSPDCASHLVIFNMSDFRRRVLKFETPHVVSYEFRLKRTSGHRPDATHPGRGSWGGELFNTFCMRTHFGHGPGTRVWHPVGWMNAKAIIEVRVRFPGLTPEGEGAALTGLAVRERGEVVRPGVGRSRVPVSTRPFPRRCSGSARKVKLPNEPNLFCSLQFRKVLYHMILKNI